jgi:hypothetical protein
MEETVSEDETAPWWTTADEMAREYRAAEFDRNAYLGKPRGRIVTPDGWLDGEEFSGECP